MVSIDQEFKALIPPLSSDEFQQLETNIILDGCRDAIILWNDIIIDGHNRQEICKSNNIDYKTTSMSFDSRDDAKIWIINNQFGRRNIPNYVRAKLALELKPLIAARAKVNQSCGQGGILLCHNSDKANEVIDTKKELAKKAGVSHDTIAKVERIERQASPELKQAIESGVVSINAGEKVSQLPKSEQVEIVAKGEKEIIAKAKELTRNKYAKVADRMRETGNVTQSKANEIIKKDIGLKLGDILRVEGKNSHYLIIGDCFNDEVICLAGDVDCVVTDPPYGISYKSPTGNGLVSRGDYDILDNDEKKFNPDILFRYCKNAITWGANHYANKLDNSAGWLVWDKRDGDAINNNSDCELAWTNMIGSARMFHHKWNGMIKASEQRDKRIHPTQKPIKLFEWALDICGAGKKIADIFSGSGACLLACENTGRSCFAVELSPVLAAGSVNRFMQLGLEVYLNDVKL